jgi:pyruvate kinase
MTHNTAQNLCASTSQIVATIGPASKDKATLIKMIQGGMDLARLNFSHGTHEEHAAMIKNIREAADEVGKRIAIIQDLSGPRMNTAEGHALDKSATRVVTEKDIDDLKFGVEQKVDYVVLSFVGTVDDVLDLRNEMSKLNADIPIIAKIERQEGLDNLDAIIDEADAVMIGRGDLGDNIPLEEVPFAQKRIIRAMKKIGKPVITATQMLLSMTENDRPTRAEVSDVANAILDGSDAVMLSEESARGKYPVEAVTMMERIVNAAEHYKLGVNAL